MKQTKVFVFGTRNDPLAWEVAGLLRPGFPNIEFIKSDSPDDIAATKSTKGRERIIIMDTARGIKKPGLLSIDDIIEKGAVTTHDIDLGMTLKLLKKTGKIDNKKVRIIGIPMNSRPDATTTKSVGRMLLDILREYANTF
jgi:Ni,Fe-hydrogenase maturation factor